MARILTMAGSSRTGSFNDQAVRAVGLALEGAGAEMTHVSLRDYPAPIYDGDLEKSEGQPASIQALKTAINEHEGLVLGCPEYNGFMTPLLINTIDWATRSDSAGVDLSAFRDKPVLVVSASPGGGGGGRAATHLKSMLGGIGCLVFPDALSVPAAHSAFRDGTPIDENLQSRIAKVAQRFHDFVSRNS